MGMMLLFAAAVPTQASIQVAQGSLSTSTDVIAADGWTAANDGFKIAWDIAKDWNGAKWIYSYKYTLSDADGTPLAPKLSHWIMEVSTNFTTANIWEVERNGSALSLYSGDPQTYSVSGSNPNMPAPIFGIKFDGPTNDGDAAVYTFLSDRRPMDGDFYAKDGKHDGIWATAWNSGLSGAGSATIPVPDTGSDTPPVPEPTTIIIWSLLGALAITVGWRRRMAP
jgi:hypothetical protein